MSSRPSCTIPRTSSSGICLRGKPGWGENMAYVSTLVNTYGGRWFDTDWNTTIVHARWEPGGSPTTSTS